MIHYQLLVGIHVRYYCDSELLRACCEGCCESLKSIAVIFTGLTMNTVCSPSYGLCQTNACYACSQPCALANSALFWMIKKVDPRIGSLSLSVIETTSNPELISYTILHDHRPSASLIHFLLFNIDRRSEFASCRNSRQLSRVPYGI